MKFTYDPRYNVGNTSKIRESNELNNTVSYVVQVIDENTVQIKRQ